MRYQIIEHETRGVLVDYDELEQKPKFRWSIPRTDDAAMAFYSESKLTDMLNKLTPTVFLKCSALTIELVNGRRRVLQ